jgi:methionyl-tRNA formyltransferase
MDLLRRIVFGGDRAIAVRVLRHLKRQGIMPLILLLPDIARATHAEDLQRLCPGLDRGHIIRGKEFRSEWGKKLLKKFSPDYIICVHFPYLLPPDVLSIPKYGALNLHPAYLPWNRGWHTATWAIWDRTPFGATLHFMNEEVDAGDIVHQKRVRILPDDTADRLYKRVMKLEYAVFKEAWPKLASGTNSRKPQIISKGTFHGKETITNIQRLDLKAPSDGEEVLRRLRALTTSVLSEAAYFEFNGTKHRLQIAFPDNK